jgi:hypothetical protein
MENGHRMSIIDDYGSDTITIYWRSRTDQYREEWYYLENGALMAQTFEQSEGYAPSARKPFLVLPNRMGRLFLELIGAEISKYGLNTQKEDMRLGKVEILEHELAFNKEQLVKFIDHFTKSV